MCHIIFQEGISQSIRCHMYWSAWRTLNLPYYRHLLWKDHMWLHDLDSLLVQQVRCKEISNHRETDHTLYLLFLGLWRSTYWSSSRDIAVRKLRIRFLIKIFLKKSSGMFANANTPINSWWVAPCILPSVVSSAITGRNESCSFYPAPRWIRTKSAP